MDADRREILDDGRLVLGQIARGFNAPPGVAKAHAGLLDIVSWDKERSEPKPTNTHCRCSGH